MAGSWRRLVGKRCKKPLMRGIERERANREVVKTLTFRFYKNHAKYLYQLPKRREECLSAFSWCSPSIVMCQYPFMQPDPLKNPWMWPLNQFILFEEKSVSFRSSRNCFVMQTEAWSSGKTGRRYGGEVCDGWRLKKSCRQTDREILRC